MSSSMKTTEKKKLSGKAKGYLILIVLLVASWVIFKIATPGNFGSPKQMLQYFQASLLAATGAVGFYFVMVMGMFDFSIGANIVPFLHSRLCSGNEFRIGICGICRRKYCLRRISRSS